MNVQLLTAAYLAGEPLATIAARAGITAAGVQARLAAAGIPRRTTVRREQALAELPALAAAGATLDDIKTRYGVSATTVADWTRRTGVKLPRKRRHRQSKVDDATIADLVRAYNAGATLGELAAGARVTKRHVCRLLRDAGAPPRTGTTIDDTTIADLVRAYNAGATLGELAATARVTTRQVCRLLRDAGAPPRTGTHPTPEPRSCACGCGRIFTPSGYKAARGAGRFCSRACWYTFRREHPLAVEHGPDGRFRALSAR